MIRTEISYVDASHHVTLVIYPTDSVQSLVINKALVSITTGGVVCINRKMFSSALPSMHEAPIT